MLVLLILGTNDLFLLWYVWNNIYLVLAVFNDSLFISSHSFILNSSAFVKKSGSVFWGLVRFLSVRYHLHRILN